MFSFFGAGDTSGGKRIAAVRPDSIAGQLIYSSPPAVDQGRARRNGLFCADSFAATRPQERDRDNGGTHRVAGGCLALVPGGWDDLVQGDRRLGPLACLLAKIDSRTLRRSALKKMGKWWRFFAARRRRLLESPAAAAFQEARSIGEAFTGWEQGRCSPASRRAGSRPRRRGEHGQSRELKQDHPARIRA